MKVFILISGKFGVGKTISASYIASSLGGKRLSFASKVKEAAYLMGWDGKKDDRGRKFLQLIGKLGRWYNQDVWAEYLIKDAKNYDIIVVDDWRFLNELDVCSKYGKVFKIRVFRNTQKLYSDESVYKDESETSLPEGIDFYDYVVYNNGGFDDLFVELDKIVNSITEEIKREE